MKILGSDFDGTLNYGGIDTEKLDAIVRWRAAGNRFGIISGRNLAFRELLAKKHPDLPLDFLACLNGAYIVDASGALISETYCSAVSVEEAVAELFALGCEYVHVNASRYLFVADRLESRPENISDDNFCLRRELPSFPFFYQLSVRLPSLERSAALAESIRRRFDGALNPLQNSLSVDIVASGMNKAEGLRRVMEYYGANHEDVIAVGDNFNDADMLRAFRSYAMENGVAEMKSLAGATVRSVTELIKREM